MLTLPPSVKIHIAVEPCDMRKQFDGLVVMVEQVLRQEACSGHLFVFLNKRATLTRNPPDYRKEGGWNSE